MKKILPTIESVLPTPAASSKIADVYMLLEDAYDKAARRYRPGWSDERVAKESGASVILVGQRRAQDYGPVPPPEPPPMEAIKRLAETLAGEIRDIHERSTALAARAAALDERCKAIAAIAGRSS